VSFFYSVLAPSLERVGKKVPQKHIKGLKPPLDFATHCWYGVNVVFASIKRFDHQFGFPATAIGFTKTHQLQVPLLAASDGAPIPAL
jgi:hypothetical protein